MPDHFHIVDGSRLHQAPVVEDDHLVGDALHFVKQVRRVKHRAAFLLHELNDALQEVATHRHVESGGRLVENQEFGIAAQRQDERHLRLHAAGEMADLLFPVQAESVAAGNRRAAGSSARRSRP